MAWTGFRLAGRGSGRIEVLHFFFRFQLQGDDHIRRDGARARGSEREDQIRHQFWSEILRRTNAAAPAGKKLFWLAEGGDEFLWKDGFDAIYAGNLSQGWGGAALAYAFVYGAFVELKTVLQTLYEEIPFAYSWSLFLTTS